MKSGLLAFVISELAELNHHPKFALGWAVVGMILMIISLLRTWRRMTS